MFTKPKTNSELDRVIALATEQLNDYSVAEEGFTIALTNVERLYALKAQKAKWRVSPDTMAIVMGNILITWSVVGHERAGIVTSKFSQFLTKAVK